MSVMPSTCAKATQIGGPAERALESAGIGGRVEVAAFEQGARELYAPGYMVVVDHELQLVVVALRGTSSVADAMSDLACEPAALQLGGHAGAAHGGMLTAARRLSEKLASLAEAGLEKLAGPRRILVTGHSLGAGVAALLTALWRDQPRFASSEVSCLAFACPQVLSAELAVAVSNHTTSIIVGDDLVPRFSLATAYDLQRALLHLRSPQEYGLDPSLHMDEVLAMSSRNEERALADAYAVIQRAALTSPNRLFSPGQLVHLVPGHAPGGASQEEFNEIRISSDMASAHRPRRYLLAVQEALATAAGP